MLLVALGEFYHILWFCGWYVRCANLDVRHTLIPPRGYSIAGVYGSCGQWIDGFGLIITR